MGNFLLVLGISAAFAIFVWAVVERNRIKKSVFFRWYDFYVGWYYDKTKKILYILPLPMLGFRIWLKHPEVIYQKMIVTEQFFNGMGIHTVLEFVWKERINENLKIGKVYNIEETHIWTDTFQKKITLIIKCRLQR